MYSANTPKCHLEAKTIAEPSQHLKLFVVASMDILLYTPHRTHPLPAPTNNNIISSLRRGTLATEHTAPLLMIEEWPQEVLD